MQQRFGADLYGPERQARWENVKRENPPGREVVGVVFLCSHFGVWIDLGVGFPALLEMIYIDWPLDCPRNAFSFKIGDSVRAKVLRFREEGRQIYLWQRQPKF